MTDLSHLSDEEINREYWRRVNARRTSSGRPKKMQACPSCGLEFATAELRKHRPFCHTLTKQQALEAARKLMVIVRSGWQWSVVSASGCLPPGWGVSRLAEDTDFQPCTIKHFTAAFRAYARPTPRGSSSSMSSQSWRSARQMMPGAPRFGNTPTCEDCDQPQDHCTCGDEEASC